MMKEYFMIVRWKNRPLTTREYLEFSRGLLQILVKFDAVFSNLFSWGNGPNQKVWFLENYSDLDNKIFPLISIKEFRYQNPDPNNWGLTLDSKSHVGFSRSYYNTDKSEEGKLSVSIDAGAAGNSTNVVHIEFPEVNYSQFYDYEFVSALIKIVIEYCQPQEGFVISHPFWDAVRSEDAPRSTCPIGWLTYLADQTANDTLPSDVECEVLSTGGTLITLKHSPPPSPDNPEDVANAIRIRDAMMPLLLDE